MPISPASTVSSSKQAAFADEFFSKVTHDGSWTGGDGTYSVPLKDGRTAWIFGDSFLGGVQKDGSRSHDPETFVRTSLVVQDGPSFVTHTGDDGGVPIDLALPPGAKINRNGSGPDEWYWPGHGTERDGDLKLFMNRFDHPHDEGGGVGWNWRYKGTDLVTVDPNTGAVRQQTSLMPRSDTIWGAAVLEREDFTYMYGSSEPKPGSMGREAKVARAPKGAIDSPSAWTYWDGKKWGTDAEKAASIGAGTSVQFGVLGARDGTVLLTTQTGFERKVHAYRAPSPEGPFTYDKVIAEIPDPQFGRHTYNSVPHPQFANDEGDLTFSYNVGGIDFLAKHESYRPKFVVAKGALKGS